MLGFGKGKEPPPARDPEPVAHSRPASAPVAEAPRSSVWHKNGGVYFGHQCEPPPNPDRPITGSWPSLAAEHLYRGEGHITTFGPPGSGKTRLLLMPNLARLVDWSIVVVDPKGTLAAHTASHRKAAGQEILTLDPFGVLPANYPRLVEKYPYLRSVGHNPLAALEPSDPEFVDEAKRLAEALIKIDVKGEKHWAASAQALVKGLCLANRVLFPASSLSDIRKLIGAPPAELAKNCKMFVADRGEAEPAIAASLNRFSEFNADNREVAGIVSTAATQTDWLDSEPIQNDLHGKSHDFRSLKTRPTTVYLVIPPRFLASHGTWLRIMINSILSPLLRSVEDSKVPVLFMLDEFAQLGHMQVIQDNIGLTREYGVKLWTIWQYLSQAKELYGDRFEDFIASAGVLQTFNARDTTTRDYLSKLSGQRLYWFRTGGTSTQRTSGDDSRLSMGETAGLTHIQGPEYWPHDLGQIEAGQGVLFDLDRGNLLRSVLPQPEKLASSDAMMAAARRDIDG